MTGTRQEITVGNQPISYIRHGNGPRTVLFLHGWGGSAESFQELWTAFNVNTERFSFIAIDLPGFGQSPPPALPWSVHDYMECVVQYLDLMSISQADLVTHSFGGRVALYLGAQHPQRIGKSILIAAAGKRTDEKTRKKVENASSTVKKIFMLPGLRKLFPIIRTIGYKLIGGQDYLKVDGVMRETFQNVVEEDLSHLFPTYKSPTQLYWGINDTYVPLTVGKEMEQSLPNATLTIFEDGKHGIHRTHAEQIALSAREFLNL